jgi:S-DNA-T family DNA segregation ATPase FtsK/SpoIIIE
VATLLILTEFAPVTVGRAWARELRRRAEYRKAQRQGVVDAGPEPHPTPIGPPTVPAEAAAEPASPPPAPPPSPKEEAQAVEAAGSAPAPERPAAASPEALVQPEAAAEPETKPKRRRRRAGTSEPEAAAPDEEAAPDDDNAEAPAEDGAEQAEEPPEAPLSEPERPADQADLPQPLVIRSKTALTGSTMYDPETARPDAARPPAQPAKPMGVGPDYKLPPVDLLDEKDATRHGPDEATILETAARLEKTLAEFDVEAKVVEVDQGPVVTLYEIDMAPGIKIGKIVGLSDDIARALKAHNVRIVAPIPGKGTVGIEVPNATRETVSLGELLRSGVLERKRLAIPMLIGKDSSGQPLVADLAQMPHCLIAGATGTGKSVCMNSLILSLLLTQRPDHLKLLLVDPKMVEFSVFQSVPHLMAPVLTDMKRATAVLEWATVKMDERYELFSRVGARNIQTFNGLGEAAIHERLAVEPDAALDDIEFHLPYIVIIIDELADLMMISGKEVENSIIRLSQKSRAVGIHLIIATQRPSVDVITGIIKSNLPCRIALQVAQKVDSRTILDRNGAEKLLGMGDMLFLPPGSSKLIRAQGTYVSDEEIRRVVKFLQAQAEPQFDPDLVRQRSMSDKPPWERDDLFIEAVRIVAETQRGSVSLLQRRLTVGYSRAARLVDMMAEMGLVGDYKGSQAREVLITPDEWEKQVQEMSEPS